MNDIAIARAIHVLAVVVWIGGVAMVTTVFLTLVRRSEPGNRLALFEAVERRFIWQARTAVILVGASGLYMVERLNLWYRFQMPEFWWMSAMVGVWLIFAFVLFVGEPLLLHRWIKRRALTAPDATFAFLHRLHWVLLILSAITILAAVAGSYGMVLLP